MFNHLYDAITLVPLWFVGCEYEFRADFPKLLVILLH